MSRIGHVGPVMRMCDPCGGTVTESWTVDIVCRTPDGLDVPQRVALLVTVDGTQRLTASLIAVGRARRADDA